MGQAEQEKARLVEDFGRMYDELRAWRAEHRRASFDEIAAQVTPRRRALMGELLAQLACEGDSDEVVAGVVCERCRREMRYKGEFKRGVIHYIIWRGRRS
jgi:hypothetical protein